MIRTGERFGAVHVIGVLRGSRDKRILEMEHDRLSVYGIAKDLSRGELREIVTHLQARGLLLRKEGEYASLTVSVQGRDFLQQRRKLSLPRIKSAEEPQRVTDRVRERGPSIEDADYDPELFEELRDLRRRLADEQNVPPFVVFGDVSLRHMAALMPQSQDNFGRVQGVGTAKLGAVRGCVRGGNTGLRRTKRIARPDGRIRSPGQACRFRERSGEEAVG